MLLPALFLPPKHGVPLHPLVSKATPNRAALKVLCYAAGVSSPGQNISLVCIRSYQMPKANAYLKGSGELIGKLCCLSAFMAQVPR